MTLRELEGELVALVKPAGHRTVETVAEASGVLFLCPTCFAKNGGPIGTHMILAWFVGRGVPDEMSPGPGRWTATGATVDDLTLHPSVNAGNEHWHGWVQNGRVQP